MKILFLSDLHICDNKVRPKLETFQANFEELIPTLELDLHIASEIVLTALTEHIGRVEPDVLVIAGDVSALGDDASLSKASDWLTTARREMSRSSSCLIVPGNHDALLGYLHRVRDLGLGKYRQKLGLIDGSAASILLKLAKRKLLKCMSPLSDLMEPDPGPLLSGFFDKFRGIDDVSLQPLVKNMGGPEQAVAIIPFMSVSSDFLWMNAGTARAEQWGELRSSLNREDINKEGVLRIVVTHHNPISSPGKVDSQLVYAYNGMPGGTNFLKELQSKGVDIVAYGHQHSDATYLYDFALDESGHCYGLGIPSSTDEENGGTVLMTVEDVNHVNLQKYRYDHLQGEFKVSGDREVLLPLERHRPVDAKTASVRYEVKRYLYHDSGGEEVWEELQGEGETLIYMSGRRFDEVSATRFSKLHALLRSGARVRILSNNPAILRQIGESKGGESSPGLWGPSEELVKLADDAAFFFEKIEQFISSKLSDKERERLDVRQAHTLLAFGSFVRDADQPWGKMTLKILPVGAFGALPPALLRLNRRMDWALYAYYLEYLKYLFREGSSVSKSMGLNWSYGEKDLESVFEAGLTTVVGSQ